MSTIIICVILAAAVCIGIRSVVKRASSGCCGGGDTKRVKTDTDLTHYNYKYTVGIEGMHCKKCKQSVENALNSLGGIYATADLDKKNAVIYSKEKCDEFRIRGVIGACGFSAKEMKACNEG